MSEVSLHFRPNAGLPKLSRSLYLKCHEKRLIFLSSFFEFILKYYGLNSDILALSLSFVSAEENG